jgi:2-iminobutanoate/2-iminopropanoate deaminase
MNNGLKPFSFGMPWEDTYGFAQALRNGSTLYISGQLSHDMEANFVGEGDFELQVRTTFANIDRILEAHGARRDHIVETTVYVKGLRERFDDIARLHRAYFVGHRPTSTVLGVTELALPPQLVEISAVALLGELSAASRLRRQCRSWIRSRRRAR